MPPWAILFFCADVTLQEGVQGDGSPSLPNTFWGCRGRSLPAGVWGVPRISLFSSLDAAGGENGREKSAVPTQTSVPTTTFVPIVPKRVRERGRGTTLKLSGRETRPLSGEDNT